MEGYRRLPLTADLESRSEQGDKNKVFMEEGWNSEKRIILSSETVAERGERRKAFDEGDSNISLFVRVVADLLEDRYQVETKMRGMHDEKRLTNLVSQYEKIWDDIMNVCQVGLQRAYEDGWLTGQMALASLSDIRFPNGKPPDYFIPDVVSGFLISIFENRDLRMRLGKNIKCLDKSNKEFARKAKKLGL